MTDYNYQPESKSWATKFLTSQSDGLVLATRPPNSLAQQFVLAEAAIQNRSAGEVVCGIGGRFPVALWQAGFWDDSEYAAGTPYLDDTVDAQDAGATDFPLGTVSVNNDGFLVACEVPFSIVSVVVGTAASGGAPAWELNYSIATLGTGFTNNWKALTNAFVAPLFTATGEQLIWFESPVDWVPVTAATAIVNRHGLGVPQKYCIVIRETTAGTVSPGVADILVLGRMLYSTEGLADNNVYLISKEGETRLPPQCDAICTAISVANPQNRATIKYRMGG